MSERRQFCTFFLDNQLFGVEVREVQEVIRHLDITRVPRASQVVRGLINLRGQIVTAIDLRRRLGLGDRADIQAPMNVVVRAEGNATCLLVDDIGDVLDVEEENFERCPETLTGEARSLIRGAYKLKDCLLLSLDTARVVNLLETNA